MKRFLVYLKLAIFLLLVLTACSINLPATTVSTDVGDTPTSEPTVLTDVSSTPMPDSTSEAGGDSSLISAPATISSEVASRTPVPTRPPGFLEREINQVSSETGWGDVTFLGLTTVDWINIVVSILID